MKPPPGVELPPIVGILSSSNESGNSFHHGGSHGHGNNSHGHGGGHGQGQFNRNSFDSNQHSSNQYLQLANTSLKSLDLKRDTSPQTRHARRIYVGGIPPCTVESDMSNYFNDLVIRGIPPALVPTGGPPVLSVYLNLDKCFAFVEFPSVEIAAAAMKLDGIQYAHVTGMYTLRIRRPHDFKPELVPSSLVVPDFTLAEFKIIGTAVTDGPGKVFVGGLPYHLKDEEVKELLSAFGPLKAFNLVRDPGSITSKGFGFCEYYDLSTTNLAIQSLNDMPIGEKKLSVRIAEVKTTGAAGAAGGGMGMGMGMLNPYMAMGMAGVGGGLLPSSFLDIGMMGMGNALAGNVNSAGLLNASIHNARPTTVLRLENMVTSDELQDDSEYEDILGDVREECSQYGALKQVLIPRCKSGFPPECEGFIFVEFANTDSAASAARNLFGRKFADKTVIVNYYDELKFQNRVLI